jgi:hypothetical protein
LPNLTRRRNLFLTASLAGLLLCSASAFAQSDVASGKLIYRGFTVDVSGAPDFAAIENSVKHQLDIVADCGAKPEILAFFRSQEIRLRPGSGDGGGHFDPESLGVTVDASPSPPANPVILHELLYAYHYRVMNGRFRNADILDFYEKAKQAGYQRGANMLRNPQEFFAVTASLYLWGSVDRPPHTRENLKAKQPEYYDWLGQLFGVQK